MHGGTGRAGDDGIGRQEGLDERGEAPPPYKPRTSAERRVEMQESAEEGVEMQRPGHAVTRQDVGLKPPDYEEVHVRPS